MDQVNRSHMQMNALQTSSLPPPSSCECGASPWDALTHCQSPVQSRGGGTLTKR